LAGGLLLFSFLVLLLLYSTLKTKPISPLKWRLLAKTFQVLKTWKV
jgi:hypothetical protein